MQLGTFEMSSILQTILYPTRNREEPERMVFMALLGPGGVPKTEIDEPTRSSHSS